MGKRLLDLFCKAGGASMGYHRAGFEVVGVDIEPQPNYPFEFIQADAMTFPLDGFDAIHASPPCQAYAKVTDWRGSRSDHPMLIDAVRERLKGLMYVIENVPDARGELINPIMLCGSQFGLSVRRHRFFEIPSIGFTLRPPCQHRSTDAAFDHGGKQSETEYAKALGCDWMTGVEARQAIPPAYTQWIGTQLLRHCDPPPRLRQAKPAEFRK